MIPWLWLPITAWLAFLAGILFHCVLTWAQSADHEADAAEQYADGWLAGWPVGFDSGVQQERCMALAEQQIDEFAAQAWRE